ncbi:glycosyltransferase family 4 protein [Patescibacteria group bacterium]
MRNTLLVSLQFPPDFGGVQTYLYEIARRIPSDQLTVLAPQTVSNEDPKNVNIVRKKFITRLIWPRWIPLLISMVLQVRRSKISLILAAQILPVGTAAYIIRKLFNIPYAVFTHGMDITIPLAKSRKRRLATRILKNAEVIFSVSNYTREKVLSMGINPEKVIILKPCIDLKSIIQPTDDEIETIRKKYAVTGKPILLTVARLVKRKGHELVLKSISKLIEEFPSLQYIIVGDGPEANNIDTCISSLHLSNNVVRTSEIDDRVLHALYELCDIFVFTPTHEDNETDVEGFGIVYHEAMAHRKPVVASRTGGVPDAVGQSSGIIVQQNNVEEITQAIRILSSDPIQRQKFGENGFKYVSSRLWDKEMLPLFKVLNRRI